MTEATVIPTPRTTAQLDVPADARPHHIAIIMDGNGRWAQKQGKPRIFGHEKGAEATRRILAEGVRLGIEAITLYSFSVENWKRPEAEIDFLMKLCRKALQSERELMMKHNIRFRHIGRREGLPQSILDEIDEVTRLSEKHTGMTVALALNYGGRQEITDAAYAIAQKAATGELSPQDISENTITEHLSTAGLSDPDLMIRTAGEMRLSNFLLWQISYAEFWVTPTLWPDFSETHLHQAIRDYARRQRKFGGVIDAV